VNLGYDVIMDKTTGERIKSLRLARELTQEELVAIARRYVPDDKILVRESLSRIENHRSRADAWTLSAIAKALDTTTDYLMGRTDDPSVSGEAPFPVPKADLWKIIAQLNEMPLDVRQGAVALLEGIIEYGKTWASSRRPETPAREPGAQALAAWAGQPADETMLETLLDSPHEDVAQVALDDGESLDSEQEPNGDGERWGEGRRNGQ
jgi:transcriptional regulator with XRE-family HTH domain